MADAIAARGAKVVAGDWVVNRVRAVKSPAEIERVRRGAQIADEAFEQVLDEIRPGMTELQISARVDLAMAERGGEPAALRTMISAGPDVWCRTHGAPGRRPVERGDIMYFDTAGVVDRYHADLCRTVSIGADHARVREIMDVTRGSVDAVIAAVKPGDPLDVAQRVAEDYVFSRFDRDNVWWVGGYAMGLALPPDWVGHTYLSNDAFEQFTWEPGYVTNYENILYDRDGQFTASYMEMLLMTETGIEVLSGVDRGLHVAPAVSIRVVSEYQITYWRDLPSLVTARDGDVVSKIELPPRFAEKIDQVAMDEGLTGSDAYLEGWRRGEWIAGEGTPAELAAAVAARLEQEHPGMTNCYDRLDRGDLILGDGAMGTMLQERGLDDGGAPRAVERRAARRGPRSTRLRRGRRAGS